MARPREFDEEDVLDKAMTLFWERGYAGTSLGEIEAATRLGRASLYAAFGDKEGLFVKVLERFAARYDSFAEILAEHEGARRGFEALFDRWFELICASSGPRGCLMQMATTTGALELERAAEVLTASGRATEAVFKSALERAQRNGELPEGASPTLLARYLVVSAQGLSSSARSGLSRRQLEPVVALILSTVFGPK